MEPILPNISGSSRFSSVVGDVKSVVSEVANIMKSAVRDSSTLVNNLSSAVGNFKASSRSGGSASTVFSQPTPSPGSDMGESNNGGGGGKRVFSQPNIEKFGAAFSAMSTALPGANASVQQNYLATYAGAYGYGNGNLAARYDQAQALQARMFSAGSGINALDASRAMATGQSRGVGVGLSNYNNLAMGVSGMSNLTPGVGLEGTMGAYASLQRPSNVNMMRMMGIMARDPVTGQMKSYTQIADQIWNKLNAEKSGARAITKSDLASSLQPGNSLAIMLDGIAGTDGVLRGQLEAALYNKASGAKNYSREEAVSTGMQTKATASQANRTASSFNTLAQTSRSGAAGVTASNDLAAGMSNLTNAIDALTGVVKAASGVSSFSTTLSGIGNGLIGKVMGGLGLGSLLPGRAGGGPTQGNSPYIVGEQGPELFIPEKNGTVVPNSKLKFAADGAQTSFKGSQTPLSDSALQAVLTNAGYPDVATAMSVVRAESGGRSGALNPNAGTGDYSMGLFQINMIGDLGKKRNEQYLQKYSSIGYKGPESLYDPAINARIALDISKGGTDFTKAWVNTSKKLGLTTGGQITYSGESHHGVMNTSSGESYADMIKKSNPQAAAMWGTGGGGGTNNNFGGVTIVIQGAKDAKATANEVSKVLTDGTLLKSARGN